MAIVRSERGAGRTPRGQTDTDRAADTDRTSSPRIPRPDPVRSVLSWAGRSRIHRREPDLRPETSLQFDLAARYVVGPIRVGAATYHYRITDLVERYAATPTLFLFRNRGRAELRGVEIEAHTALPRGFALTATAETSRGRDAVDGTPLDDVAPAAASVTVRHAVSEKVAAYLRIKAVGSHDAAGPSEVPTQHHTLVDAGVGWHLTRHFGLRGAMRNLLNAAYQSSAGRRSVWAPGRHGSLTIVLAF
jgi:outer membrane receptor protein involved in Fe transport